MVNNCFRSLIGSDIFGELLNTIEEVDRLATKTTYPPYNILKTESGYRLEIALAGFKEDDISVVLEKNLLKVSAEKSSESKSYLYQGISARSFERTFTLDKDIEVSEADLKDGILSVDLKKIVREEDLPRQIQIKSKQVLLAE